VIAITFALPVESAGLVRLLREKERQLCGETKVLRGKIDNRRVEILHTGVGEKVCRQRVEKFLQDRQFDLLISAGFAGALTDQLKVGDLLLAKNFATAKIDQVQSLLSDHRVQPGDLVTMSRVIDSREERYQIGESTGAVAADMETDFIARACAEHVLPMLSLRAISDTPARSLPVPPGILFDIDQQKTDLGKLSLYLFKRPWLLPNTISFAGQASTARRALTHALYLLLRSNFWGPND